MLYSVRMRAAAGGSHESGGAHISGAERLLGEDRIEKAAAEMIRRALSHTKGKADFIRLTIEGIDDDKIARIPALPIETWEAANYEEGRKHAGEFLVKAGVEGRAVERAFASLTELHSNMRGAMLLDAVSGERLDSGGNRGVRVSRMDLEDEFTFGSWLSRQGLDNSHTREALVLASKVLSAPETLAELCWSDDPEYVTGYVAVKGLYHRITKLKGLNDPRGGRVFFIRPGSDIDALKLYLETRAVLVFSGED
jgi:6-carboxyhexanoate--CoA ligase